MLRKFSDIINQESGATLKWLAMYKELRKE